MRRYFRILVGRLGRARANGVYNHVECSNE
jgi:hypothetical protein